MRAAETPPVRTTLDYATHYTVQGGWHVVPVPAGRKGPTVPKWQTLRLSADELPVYFNDGQNIGVLNGEPSRWQVDVDLDTPQAADAARELLPHTGLVSGHESKPASHWFYRLREPTATRQYKDVDGAMLVELRSTGSQTLVPPSVHPSGEHYVWERNKQPFTCSPDFLLEAVGKVAAAAILARHWPGVGSRHDADNALCGALARAEWDTDDIDAFVSLVARLAGDEEWRERGDGAKGTVRKVEAGLPTTGLPTLARLLSDGTRVVGRVSEWLALPETLAQDQRRSSETKVRTLHRDDEHLSAIGAKPGGKGARKGAHDERLSTADERLSTSAIADGWDGGELLSEVTPAAIEWLWEGYIPLRKLTVSDGDPGLGKTLLFAADLSARVTTGKPMPDGSMGLSAPAGVVIFSGEDDPADTLLPRLAAAGGDASKVLAVTMIQRTDPDTGASAERLPSLADLAFIRRKIEQIDAKLVIFDPFVTYLPPTANSWRDQDVRAALAPLARLAQETGPAMVLIRHLNKGASSNPLYRGGGSIGIIGAARSGLLVVSDPDVAEKRIFGRVKGNLYRKVPSWTYSVVENEQKQPVLVWGEQSERSVQDVLGMPAERSGDGSSKLEGACNLLRNLLGKGPRPAATVEETAKDGGISQATLRRATNLLDIQKRKVGKGIGSQSYWEWWLPEQSKGAHDNGDDDAPNDEHHRRNSGNKRAEGTHDSAYDAHRRGNEHHRQAPDSNGTGGASSPYDAHLTENGQLSASNGHKPGRPCLRCGTWLEPHPDSGYLPCPTCAAAALGKGA